MKSMFLALLALALPLCSRALTVDSLPKEGDLPDGGKIWAVLVAGSVSYENYRHQADVCHAYQVLHNHGIPDENIIVMMADDVAYDPFNPTPGIIINHPNGTNVYKGVPKDYNHNDNNPDIFMKVLQGQATNAGSGRTLESGPNDHVFVYFADHGATGLIGFGDHVLTERQLNQTLQNMVDNQLFRQLVFYMEACESGSMFEYLPADLNIFATTASNSTESSYACYWDGRRQAYLGDVYSVKWMEDSDHEDLRKETLEEQFVLVKNETDTSPVCQFGNLDLAKEPVAVFQGEKEPSLPPTSPPVSPITDAVPGPEAVKITLQRRIAAAENQEDRDKFTQQLNDLMEERQHVMSTLMSVVGQATNGDNGLMDEALDSPPASVTEHDCYYGAVQAFHDKCFNIAKADWALRHMYILANLCQLGVDSSVLLQAIDDECGVQPHLEVV